MDDHTVCSLQLRVAINYILIWNMTKIVFLICGWWRGDGGFFLYYFT